MTDKRPTIGSGNYQPPELRQWNPSWYDRAAHGIADWIGGDEARMRHGGIGRSVMNAPVINNFPMLTRGGENMARGAMHGDVGAMAKGAGQAGLGAFGIMTLPMSYSDFINMGIKGLTMGTGHPELGRAAARTLAPGVVASQSKRMDRALGGTMTSVPTVRPQTGALPPVEMARIKELAAKGASQPNYQPGLKEGMADLFARAQHPTVPMALGTAVDIKDWYQGRPNQ